MAHKKHKYQVDDPIYTRQTFGIDVDARIIDLMSLEEYILPEAEGIEPGVEFAMANRFIRNLTTLMISDPEAPILVNMKTCGGDWAEGMAIHNAIKYCDNDITILNWTHARSMSSLIFQAANKRVMMPDSTFMFHGGTVGMEGTYKQFKNEAKESDITYERMISIYIESMKKFGVGWGKKTDAQVKRWLEGQMDKKEEVYLNPTQAIEHGFADEIFGEGTANWNNLLEFED